MDLNSVSNGKFVRIKSFKELKKYPNGTNLEVLGREYMLSWADGDKSVATISNDSGGTSLENDFWPNEWHKGDIQAWVPKDLIIP